MRDWWQEIVGGTVAVAIVIIAVPPLLDGPTIGGQELSAIAGEHGTGLARVVTDTVVRVAEVVLVVLLASVAGGLVAGLLRGRFVSRVRAGNMETGVVDAADDLREAQGDLWEAVRAQQGEIDELAEFVVSLVEDDDSHGEGTLDASSEGAHGVGYADAGEEVTP